MGLDMYLFAEVYVPRWDHSSPEERERAEEILKLSRLDGFQVDNAGVVVKAEAGYWRKANQIHNWFVLNVQGGEDDGGTYHLGPDELRELREVCIQVIDATELKEGLVVNGQTAVVGEDGTPVWQNNMEPGKVVVDATVAEDLLPTASGFFFGSTEYDEWYIADLTHTVETIDKILGILAEEDDEFRVSFSYHASW